MLFMVFYKRLNHDVSGIRVDVGRNNSGGKGGETTLGENTSKAGCRSAFMKCVHLISAGAIINVGYASQHV